MRAAIAVLALVTQACSVVPITRPERPSTNGPGLAARIDTPRGDARAASEPRRVADSPRPPEPPRPSEQTRITEQLTRLAGDLGEIQNATARLLATARDQEEQLRYLQRRVGELSTELTRQQEEQQVLQRRLMELSAPSRLGSTRPVEPAAVPTRTPSPGARASAPPPPLPLDGPGAAPSAAPPGLIMPPAVPAALPESRVPLAERTTSVSTPEDIHNAGLARYRAGDLDSALLIFYDLVSVHPSHPLRESAQFLIGEILYAQKDARGALTEFEELLTLSPNGPRAADGLLKIGLCLRDLGDEPRARATWQRLVREHPNSPAARQARVLLKSGRAG